jgi:hypothetical protein
VRKTIYFPNACFQIKLLMNFVFTDGHQEDLCRFNFLWDYAISVGWVHWCHRLWPGHLISIWSTIVLTIAGSFLSICPKKPVSFDYFSWRNPQPYTDRNLLWQAPVPTQGITIMLGWER